MAVFKPLCFGSVSDLQKRAKLGDTSKWNAKALCMSSEKIFKEAVDLEGLGDEEKAYIYFYKYIQCVQRINKSPEFKKDAMYFTSMYNIEKNSKKAIVTLGALAARLETRYDGKYGDNNVAERFDNLDLGNIGIKNGIERVETKNFLISHQKLYSLMNQESTNFLILDTRPTADYNNSHIDLPNSLNVPEMLLTPGATATSVGKDLKPEFRSQWERRTSVDMLILCDWTSCEFAPNRPVTLLRDAITKWDLGAKYKNPPYLLEGGFLKFLYAYPSVTYKLSKPSVSKPVMPSLDFDIRERLKAEISKCTRQGKGDHDGREAAESKTELPITIDGACSLSGMTVSEAGSPFTASKASFKKTLAHIDDRKRHLDHIIKEKSVFEKEMNLELGQLGKHKEHVESIIGSKSTEMKNLILAVEKFKKENKLKIQEIIQADQELADLEGRLAEVRKIKIDLKKGCQQNESRIVELNDKIHKLEGFMDKELEKAQVEGSSIESRIQVLKQKLIEINKVIDNDNEPSKDIAVPKPQLEESSKSWIDFINKEIDEKERDLECPVCLEVAACPIYMCSESHLICSHCRPQVKKCPECRMQYGAKPKIHRYAEKTAGELARLKNQRTNILDQQSTPGWKCMDSAETVDNADEVIKARKAPSSTPEAKAPRAWSSTRQEWSEADNNSGARSKNMRGQLKTASVSFADNQQLFVGNLPHNCCEEDLAELFMKYGKVVDVRIIKT